MTDAEKGLLLRLAGSRCKGTFATACDGPDRAPAHALEKAGLAEWRGISWGSSFWSITEAGYQKARELDG